MPRRIDGDELRRLVDQDAQLLEVLPRAENEEAHLPGAINVPLDELTRQAVSRLSLVRDNPQARR